MEVVKTEIMTGGTSRVLNLCWTNTRNHTPSFRDREMGWGDADLVKPAPGGFWLSTRPQHTLIGSLICDLFSPFFFFLSYFFLYFVHPSFTPHSGHIERGPSTSPRMGSTCPCLGHQGVPFHPWYWFDLCHPGGGTLKFPKKASPFYKIRFWLD